MEIPLTETDALVIGLVAKLDLLAQLYAGAGIAVSFPGCFLDPVAQTVFVCSGDADRIERLTTLIDRGGIPECFVFERDGEICADPAGPWAEPEQDYLTALVTHIAGTAVAEGHARWRTVH